MSEVLSSAREVLEIEAQGLMDLKGRLGQGFEKAVELILASSGKVVTTGIGKSGIIARKIMSTLNSTGTPAAFLHPVEALHGDLGMVHPGDVVLALSNSGETTELIYLVPQLKNHGAKVVAMTGGMNSALARAADAVIDCGVEREACPLGLAPTASTTAALAVGDALAVVLIKKHRFKAEDFRRHHPGGKLGERLSLTADQVLAPGAEVPAVEPEATTLQAAAIMDRGGLGVVLITRGGPGGELQGIFTDGDLRRAVVKGLDLSQPVNKLMTADPLTITPDTLAADALHAMEARSITALPMVDPRGRVLGICHLHDVLGRGEISFNAPPVG